MERLEQLLARLDALKAQERALILVASLLVLYVLWDQMLVQPLAARRIQLGTELEVKRQEIATLGEQNRLAIERSRQDPDAANRRKLEAYREQIAGLDAQLAEMTDNLIPADQMAKVIETVLARSAGLTILGVHGLGASSILEVQEPSPPVAGASPSAPGPGAAFKHGVQISFAGSYLDALAYLRALEALPYAFFWDTIDFEVVDYPRATTSIVVYTLSLDSRWMGV
jgi:MSHA biogenesis protein MshJ